jgi:hypothetical protein
MSRFYNLDQAPFNSRELSKAIVAAIAGQYNGAFFDASDMSTLFQDAAGTTPVTALEQPVGKWLDKSGNGNHATQSVTGYRPVISARKNLLTKTEDFADAAWGKNNSTVSVGNEYPPGSSINSAKIIETSTAGAHYIKGSSPALSSICTVSFYAKSAERSIATVFLEGTAVSVVWFDLEAGVAVKQSSVVISFGLSPAGEGWYYCFVTYSSAATNDVCIGCSTASWVFSYTGVAGYGIYCANPQLEYGPAATRYQKVNTATDYDTAGFPRYLRFDGVDDYLNLPFMNLYANGSATVISAVSMLRQSANACVVSEGNSADNDSLYCMARQLASGGNLDSVIIRDDATTLLDTTGSASALANGVTAIRGSIDTGSNVKLFKNDQQLSSDDYTRSGTVTLNNTTIGAKVGTTVSMFNNMRLYGLIITKTALSDSERRKCEVYLSRKAGVQL